MNGSYWWKWIDLDLNVITVGVSPETMKKPDAIGSERHSHFQKENINELNVQLKTTRRVTDTQNKGFWFPLAEFSEILMEISRFYSIGFKQATNSRSLIASFPHRQHRNSKVFGNVQWTHRIRSQNRCTQSSCLVAKPINATRFLKVLEIGRILVEIKLEIPKRWNKRM